VSEQIKPKLKVKSPKSGKKGNRRSLRNRGAVRWDLGPEKPTGGEKNNVNIGGGKKQVIFSSITKRGGKSHDAHATAGREDEKAGKSGGQSRHFLGSPYKKGEKSSWTGGGGTKIALVLINKRKNSCCRA